MKLLLWLTLCLAGAARCVSDVVSGLVYDHWSLEDEFGALLDRAEVDCDKARLLVVHLHNDCGLGAELHWLTVARSLALHTDRELVLIEEPWVYGLPPDGTWSSLFEPLSSRCAPSFLPLLDEAPVIQSQHMHEHAERRVVQLTRDLQLQLDFPFFRSIPAWLSTRWRSGERRLDCGEHDASPLFWFRSQLMHRGVFRLNTATIEFVDAERRRLAIPDRFVGLHFRQGDKAFGSAINNAEMEATEGDVARALDAALAASSALARSDQTDSMPAVYVATKVPRLHELIGQRSASGAPLVHNPNHWHVDNCLVIIDSEVERVANGWSTHAYLTGAYNQSREALQSVRDLSLLSEASQLIGQMESNFFRVAVELQAAQHSGVWHPIALQKPYWFVFP